MIHDDDDDDEFDHFTDAQDVVWPNVILELTLGQKRGHWMWFTFPVLEGISDAGTGLFFALRDLDEAREYLAHPVLGPRLQECARLLLGHADTAIATIMGADDADKLHHSATLFALASADTDAFDDILTTFFGGTKAQKTLSILNERDAMP